MANFTMILSLVALSCAIAMAFEPSPLQDFCVADSTSPVFVPMTEFSARRQSSSMVVLAWTQKFVQPAHFSFSGLHVAGNTSNRFGSVVTPVNVAQIPGLNTLGISMARIDYAAWGVLPPHMHPRATEILTVLEGTLEVGFVTSNPENRFISKVLQKGDVFIFPIGLVHYQRNVGYGSAVSISGLSSQNPGVITVANAIFGSNPPLPADMLAKAFQVDKNVVDNLQVIF